MELKRRGLLLILSSPSGAGKTTIARKLLDQDGAISLSVSATTRPMRPGEVEGRDYHFVTPDVFQQMVDRGDFAEHAFVHSNRYGTAQAPVEAALAAGRDVIFDVDWQGGAALSARWPHDSLKIFILPPDLRVLEQRLRNRATDDPKIIDKRLAKAIEELEHFSEYQHLIVNDDIERAYGVLRALYLTRKYGVVDRPGVPYPLADLANEVAANRATAPDAHARKLVGRA